MENRKEIIDYLSRLRKNGVEIDRLTAGQAFPYLTFYESSRIFDDWMWAEAINDDDS